VSRENVQLVREALARFAITGEPSGMAAPDFVWDMTGLPDWLDDSIYRGEEGFRAFFERWTEPYDEWSGELEEVIPLDDEQVAVAMLQRGRIRGAQSWVELRCGMLYTVREGQLRQARLFPTLDDALAAHRARARA
jgi:ketosteroid isomerase-like protein